MKALFIGGTGTISTAISNLALQEGWELTLLNRGRSAERAPKGAEILRADIGDEGQVEKLLLGRDFDVVADFIAFTPDQVARDIRLFRERTRQYIFISSASAYQKPPASFVITESTPLRNPYWQYSRDKIACEELLDAEYRASGFPVTIVRPSHTYDERRIPVAIHGEKGSYQVIDRMLRGKPVLVPGDGTSLWVTTFSTDFARGFLGLMGNRKAVGGAVQIMSREALTWDAIYDRIGDAFGVTVKKYHVATDFLVRCDSSYAGPMLGDKSNTVFFDTAKLEALVPGFVPQVRFDQGARLCAAYIRSHAGAWVSDEAFDRFCDRVVEAQEKAAAFFLQQE